MSNKVVKVESWVAFRHLVDEHNPEKILYNIKKGVAGKQVAILGFTLPLEGIQYVFADSVAGDRLRETGIPLHKDGTGSARIRDEDVMEFVKSRLSRKGVKLISHWTRARGRERLASAGVILLGDLLESVQEPPREEGEILDDFESLMAKARDLLEED